jgi:hypothetical protein
MCGKVREVERSTYDQAVYKKKNHCRSCASKVGAIKKNGENYVTATERDYTVVCDKCGSERQVKYSSWIRFKNGAENLCRKCGIEKRKQNGYNKTKRAEFTHSKIEITCSKCGSIQLMSKKMQSVKNYVCRKCNSKKRTEINRRSDIKRRAEVIKERESKLHKVDVEAFQKKDIVTDAQRKKEQDMIAKWLENNEPEKIEPKEYSNFYSGQKMRI